MNTRQEALTSLMDLPGVGKSIAQDLYALGMRSALDLRGQDPDEMYERSCALQGTRIDRCLLYVYRCAVYAAETKRPEPRLMKWWNWKDGKKRKTVDGRQQTNRP